MTFPAHSHTSTDALAVAPTAALCPAFAGQGLRGDVQALARRCRR